jgi:aspartate kinase
MKIFKFGGASVKDSDGVRNVSTILETYQQDKLLVVISAMGKTTNLLEKLVHSYFYKTELTSGLLKELKTYHHDIIEQLSTPSTQFLYNDVENLFLELECLIETPIQQEDYDFIYDQIVPFGELLSTKIVSSYLLGKGIKNQWIDSRNFILTDDRHRDARIRWEETEHIVNRKLKPLAEKNLVITQGFIGRGPANETTTLGREGSDYSAAIFAWCLNANSVTIWKDVAGVMNADPKKVSTAKLIPAINYSDAIELAYYGASVIHPKTIQPLRSKNIPLFVKSFVNINDPGTEVSANTGNLQVPCFIHKSDQVWVELSTKDYTFIVESNLQYIFSLLAKYKLRTNIMQNSAISFSFVCDQKEDRLENISNELESAGLKVNMTKELELLTVYNSTNNEVENPMGAKTVLLEQKSGNTIHYLLK